MAAYAEFIYKPNWIHWIHVHILMDAINLCICMFLVGMDRVGEGVYQKAERGGVCGSGGVAQLKPLHLLYNYAI